MDNFVESFDYKDYKVEIHYDTETENPLDWTTPEERGAIFVLSHKRYNLPCEIDVDFSDYDSWQELAEDVTDNKPYMFVNWLEHSGIVVSLRDNDTPSDQWDAGIAGIVFGTTTEDIKNAFADWKHYIEGDVFTFVIKDKDGEVIDSLGGLYGYDYAVEQAKVQVDWHIKEPENVRQ